MGSVKSLCMTTINGSPLKSVPTLPLLAHSLSSSILSLNYHDSFFFQANGSDSSSIHSLDSQVSLQISLAYSIVHIYLQFSCKEAKVIYVQFLCFQQKTFFHLMMERNAFYPTS